MFPNVPCETVEYLTVPMNMFPIHGNIENDAVTNSNLFTVPYHVPDGRDIPYPIILQLINSLSMFSTSWKEVYLLIIQLLLNMGW